jgi:PiT family inorganic phosphate transporter
VMWWVGNRLGGGLAGSIVIFLVLLSLAGIMYLRSRREPIDEHNVNDDWEAGAPADERLPAGTAS